MKSIDAILLPYQADWINDTSKVKVAEKGRRIGLSWCDALDAALKASRKVRPQNTYYISYNKDMTRQYISDVTYWAKKLSLLASEMEEENILLDEHDMTIYRVRFATGCEVVGMPSEPRVLRSKKGCVRIDEAAFVDDLDELLKAALALIIWGGDVGIISTHNGEDNPFNLLCQDILAGRADYSLHRITFDEALTQGLYKKICATSGQEWKPETEAAFRENIRQIYRHNLDEELNCVPRRGGGAYLPMALTTPCAKAGEVLRFTAPAALLDWPHDAAAGYVQGWLETQVEPILRQIPEKLRTFIGVDFGRSVDLSVFWLLLENKDLTLSTPLVIELRNMPYRAQEQILGFITESLERFSGMALDARGNGQALAEFARVRFGAAFVLEVMISQAFYRESMPRLKAAFEDKTLEIPKDNEILGDLRAVSVTNGIPQIGARRQEGEGSRHGDAAVALDMAIWAHYKLGDNEPWSLVTAGESTAAQILAGF